MKWRTRRFAELGLVSVVSVSVFDPAKQCVPGHSSDSARVWLGVTGGVYRPVPGGIAVAGSGFSTPME